MAFFLHHLSFSRINTVLPPKPCIGSMPQIYRRKAPLHSTTMPFHELCSLPKAIAFQALRTDPHFHFPRVLRSVEPRSVPRSVPPRNVLFWNLNYWDSACTLAGEVLEPRKVFPSALFLAMVLVISSYFFPLFVGVGRWDIKREQQLLEAKKRTWVDS